MASVSLLHLSLLRRNRRQKVPPFIFATFKLVYRDCAIPLAFIRSIFRIICSKVYSGSKVELTFYQVPEFYTVLLMML